MAAFAVTSTACGDATSGGSDWAVRVDTLPNGTIHVVNTPPRRDDGPTWVAREEVRIGEGIGSGSASFGMVRSLAALPDGRIAVLDGMAEELRIFHRDGAHLRTFGGDGAGPGELRGARGVLLDRRGRLRVAEQRNARLSVFDPDSGFVGAYPLRLYSYRFTGPWDAVIDSRGRTLVASSGPYRGGSWLMLRVYDDAMVQLDSIPYREYTAGQREPGARRIARGDLWGFLPIPFYSRPRQALDPSGEFWSSRADAATLEIARWTPPADTALVLESRRPPDPVTEAERDSALAEVGSRLTGGSVPEPSDIPRTKPPLYGLFLDDGGRLWVRITPPHADPTVYDLFERDGRHAGTASIPARVDSAVPPVVRGDTLWAVVTDELDLQHVIRAALEAARQRPD